MAEEAVISDDAAALEADTENDLQILADESVTAALPEAVAADAQPAEELTDEEVLEEAYAQEQLEDVAALTDDQSGETDLELPTENPDEALTLDAASYPTLELDKEYAISAEDGIVYYQFTPKADGVYKVFSYDKQAGDPYVYLYDGENFDPEVPDELYSNDDGNNNNNFLLKTSLEAGKTYIYGFTEYNQDDKFEYKVKFVEVEEISVTFDLNNDNVWINHWNSEKQTYDKKQTYTNTYETGDSIGSYVNYDETSEGFALQFAGWSTKKDASSPDENISASKGLVLYAVWKAEHKVTAHANHKDASYNGYYDKDLKWNEGNNESTTEKFVETKKLWEMKADGSTTYILSTPSYNYDTMNFKGWSTNKDAKEPDSLPFTG